VPASKFRTLRFVCALFPLLVWSSMPHRVYAQQQPYEEALMIFSHPSIGRYYIGVVLFGDVAFLPLGEILSLTEIPSERSTNKFGLQGYYPSPKET